MPRRKNTRPTKIYWLYDMRPETMALGWIDGLPFYCGKTVFNVSDRLAGHRFDAKKAPTRPVCQWILAVGAFLRAQTVEVVPIEANWAKRERAWIKTLRAINPDCANVSEGGTGSPGYVFTAEVRARHRAGLLGHEVSAETRAKISASTKGRVVSAETRAKMSINALNMSAETKAKISATLTGRKLSPERRAQLRETVTGRKHSAASRAKMSAAQKARGAEISAIHKGKTVSAETRLKMSVAAKLRERRRRGQSMFSINLDMIRRENEADLGIAAFQARLLR